MFHKLRTKSVQFMINTLEGLFFNPKLKSIYETILLKDKRCVVIDIGSNKGQSIELFTSVSPNLTIHGFEPNPSLYRRLTQKYKDVDGITIHNKGVSKINGKLTFNENVLDETSTFEELNYDSEYLKKKAKILGVKPTDIITKRYEVDVCRISDFLKEHNLLQVDLMKIDVEGHELQCLQGLFDNCEGLAIKMIQIESHADDMYLNRNSQNEISQLLQQQGFVEFTKIKHSFGDFHEIIYKNSQINETLRSNTSL